MTDSKNHHEIQWRCPDCLAVNAASPPSPGVGPWSCPNCSKEQPAHPEAISPAGDLACCPACGCRDLFRHRDFNRKLGLGIVLLGAAFAPWTYYLSIIGCLLIDVAIYSLTKDCAICYRCKAILRNYPGHEKIEPFDIATSEKYIAVERERGW